MRRFIYPVLTSIKTWLIYLDQEDFQMRNVVKVEGWLKS